MMGTPARFLFFLYYYPPAMGTAAKRNFHIADAIAREVHAAIIFTSSVLPAKFVKPANTTIRTIKAYDYRSLLRRNTRDGAIPETIKSNAPAQWAVRMINSFPINIILGEGGLIYFLTLLRQGRRAIREEHITHLYSSYRPFADHYAAYWLKKRNPQVTWIADFRDLMIDPHYGHIQSPAAHQVFFKKIFSTADLLTTVSDGLATHLREYNKHVITLRNGIAGEIQVPAPSASPFFSIAYTGSMFLDKRNAEPLFKALQALFQETLLDPADIRITYAGKDSNDWIALAHKFRFGSLLEDHGIVDAGSARQIQQIACINVLLTISSDHLQGVLTGKMIEYFESGSPVLGIVVGQNDPELQTMLHELQIGASFSDQPDEIEAIKAFILQEYKLWKSTGMNRKPVNTEILSNKYSTAAVMKPLLDRLTLLPEKS